MSPIVELGKRLLAKTVVEGRNVLDHDEWQADGFVYRGVPVRNLCICRYRSDVPNGPSGGCIRIRSLLGFETVIRNEIFLQTASR